MSGTGCTSSRARARTGAGSSIWRPRTGRPQTGIDWALKAAAEHDLVWLTGRPEWLRPVTETWLAAQGLPHDRLIMRPNHDYRPAREYKVSELQTAGRTDEIVVFVDDDPMVVKAAAEAGFTASLATWLPRGEALADAQDRAGRT